MNAYRFFLAAVSAVIWFPLTTMTVGQGTDSSASFKECDSRCAALDGESRYRCIKTCISTRKKNAPAGENDVKRKISECESLCEMYKGIENVKCRRICLDNKNFVPTAKKESAAKENPSPCESICSILTGPSRDTCITRCEKKGRFSSKGVSEK